MNAKTVTFNMPIPIYQELRIYVGRKNMSRFVSEAVKDKLSKEREKLRASYLSAERDRIREKDIADWSTTEGESWT